MTIEWSAAAVADLDRFATFLHEKHPAGAHRRAISSRQDAGIEAHPQLGYPIGRGRYRQIVLEVLRAKYVIRYRLIDERIVIMRVWHGRERRS